MKQWVKYRATTGEAVGTGIGEEMPEDGDGLAYLEIALDEQIDPRLWQVVDGALVLRDEPLPAPTPPRLYSFNAWVDLFPIEEQLAIVAATMTDPMAKLIYDRAQSASGSIDPTDPRTKAGLGYLVSKGYVAQATFDRIAAWPAA